MLHATRLAYNTKVSDVSEGHDIPPCWTEKVHCLGQSLELTTNGPVQPAT